MSIISVDTANKHISISGGYGGISPTYTEWIEEAPLESREVINCFRDFIKKSRCYGDSAMSINSRRKNGLYWKFYIGNDIKWSISFSFRGWGDFMAASEDICEPMGYMNYY